MEAFLISAGSVAIAEMGDRTQLLALLLAARFRRPWPIVAGILAATLANHTLAAAVGVWFGRLLTPALLDSVVGISMLAMAAWTLFPDRIEEDDGLARRGRGVFFSTLICFFLAETGDKTQIATVALAAAYSHLAAVVAGTTLGMMIANVPVVFMGRAFAGRLPLKAITYGAAAIFAVLAGVFLMRAMAS